MSCQSSKNLKFKSQYNAMMVQNRGTGSSPWFWTGVFILALIIFISSASLADFIESYSTVSEWPIGGMFVIEIPLLLFGIYCLRKGKSDRYSLKADLLPVLIIFLLLGLLRFSPREWSAKFPLTLLLIYLLRGAVPPLAFVFLLTYLLHRRVLRKMGIVSIPRKERNRRVIELQRSSDEAFNLCMSALSLVGARIWEVDESSGLVIAKTGLTVRSWGETITISICEVDNGVRIEVLSEPRFPLQYLDYGKNYENVKKIADFLSKVRER